MINHIKQESHEYKKFGFQILAHEISEELWLKRHEYLRICRLGTLNKLSNNDYKAETKYVIPSSILIQTSEEQYK